ncbi:MAG: dihydrofolate reductase family protein [Candidatus Aminicenantes bacterium]|nr:dihydrofolate reductase family protein [Candidatus Aminicenantes bacterium]
MKPRVILHNAVSADGRMDWFRPNLEAYYELAGRFEEDVTLVGSGTLLGSPEGETISREPDEIIEARKADSVDDRPILAVPDSGDRVKNWVYLRSLPFWRDVFALSSSTASPEQIDRFKRQRVPYFLSGRTKVDLAASLSAIGGRFGAKTIRVDSGGTLNGALLREGLVDEISLLIHPQYVGGISPRTLFRAEDLTAADGVIDLELAGNETLAGGLIWLRYNVITKSLIGLPED